MLPNLASGVSLNALCFKKITFFGQIIRLERGLHPSTWCALEWSQNNTNEVLQWRRFRLWWYSLHGDGDWHCILLLWWYWLWQWWGFKVMFGNFTTGPTFSALHCSIEILTISQAPKPNVGYCVYQGKVGPWMNWYEILRPNEMADISKIIEMVKVFGKFWWRQNCYEIAWELAIINVVTLISHIAINCYWLPCGMQSSHLGPKLALNVILPIRDLATLCFTISSAAAHLAIRYRNWTWYSPIFVSESSKTNSNVNQMKSLDSRFHILKIQKSNGKLEEQE